MLEDLKKYVYEQNMRLPKLNLVNFTWGNVSAVDRNKELFVIKPSGVDYNKMKPDDMVVCDFDGKAVEGDLNPSSDTPTHAYLYKHFKKIGGIVHTHSPWAVSFAQAGIDVPALGTTHADTFYGSVPVSDALTKKEIESAYEYNTGVVISRTFKERNIDYMDVPAVLVRQHGPFTWGETADKAVYNAKVLEIVSEMDYHTLQLTRKSCEVPQFLLDKHYYRKHGRNAYYGQK
ncbi:L-ribulose-5-phosphate 4-epimerase [Companilactobacillus kimchii]|uniref:L-ribulose-5-phosphate 4-epimerase n=2 Tax=Companilactobacillus kimchii TaxID=2801452 RepID=A0ABR5NXB3_9LACO|nr:L-ribulose-5-phosphate 4-epimerase [Companilactobacillus kimchii]KAE9559857.1 ribulose phosphate epimerase [Companilactobacillus kimchii]KRK53366.1 L-ribulose-5-phosphate 4-epimerase [Companilactobacillus kimchii DSM 13961 = JCM 10707]OWF33393.1 L-ribulose-5-phosphate 4-epimerase [Companilactobacillus kimchii]GEO46473.1 L-ribulose-5-phosphate 4-epimerase [Companilactobacillus paralimentarius]